MIWPSRNGVGYDEVGESNVERESLTEVTWFAVGPCAENWLLKGRVLARFRFGIPFRHLPTPSLNFNHVF
jgi:hypothetical protein